MIANCVTDTKGKRAYMEDRYTSAELELGSAGTAYYFGVYDGHGGESTATALKELLHLHLQKQLHNVDLQNMHVLHAKIKAAWDSFDYCLDKYDTPDGSTATVAVYTVQSNQLHLINTGDSRTVVWDGKNLIATRDHKPDDPEEKARIIAAGGFVSNPSFGPARVNGILAVARAFGDTSLTPYGVVATPNITSIPLTEPEYRILLASDGLWDVLSNEIVKDMSSDSCKELVEQALNKGSTDNITVMYVVLEPKQQVKMQVTTALPPGCEKKNIAKYLNRPGPPYPAQECPNVEMLGNNGLWYRSMQNKGGVYTWRKIGKPSLPTAVKNNNLKAIAAKTPTASPTELEEAISVAIDDGNAEAYSVLTSTGGTGCVLSKACPQAYKLEELQEIAKECGIKKLSGTKKDLCISIRNVLGGVGVGGKYDVIAKGVMLANEYLHKKTGKPIVDPVGWLLSEKFDGVRAVWDGTNFVSRSGKVYHAPDWFKTLMPKNIVLDGELFIGRDKFQQTVSVVRKLKPIDKEWEKITYQVFDLPTSKDGAEKRVDEYLKVVKEICNTFKPSVHLKECPIFAVEQTQISSAKDLEHFYDNILAQGGEGAMLRRPGSLYVGKRSNDLLKYKPSFDAEAKIIDFELGTGKNKGKLGAFVVKDIKTGKQFKVGSGLTDAIRTSYLKTHPVGTVITYQYTGLTDSGVARHPRYLRIRKD